MAFALGSPASRPAKYASLTMTEYLHLFFQILKLPFVLALALISSRSHHHNINKTWRRVITDTAYRQLSSLSIPQVQLALGTTLGTYTKVMAKLGLRSVVEDVLGCEPDSKARLLWVGPKRVDRVLLYLHGGGFFAPVQDVSIYFWRYVQLQLKTTHEIDLGVVILNYSLFPEATFPTPLRQAVAAISHLQADGLQLQNLYIAGDSAGGNLIAQLFSHALHPLTSVSLLQSTTTIATNTNKKQTIRGACIISPWVSLSLPGDTGSHLECSTTDIVSPRAFREFGRAVLSSIPTDSHLLHCASNYIEPCKAPAGWFRGLETVVDRVLITAGGNECLRDDIVAFYDKLKAKEEDNSKGGCEVELVVQEGGVHNDLFLDFLVPGEREESFGELTPRIVGWLAEGMKHPTSK